MLASNIAYRINKNGEKVYKNVDELKNSNHIILIQCDDCGEKFETIFSNRKNRISQGKSDLCNSCSKKGKRNSQYGKDRSDLIKYARSKMKQNPMKGKKHTEEAKLKMSNSKVDLISSGAFDIKSNNRGHKLKYYSIKNKEEFYADSALEMLRMIQLDKDELVDKWTKRHGIKIEYYYNDIKKCCVPDFLIFYNDSSVAVEEVKGYVKDVELIKKDAIQSYCINNGFKFKFTTQKDMNLNGEYRKFLKKLKEDNII